MTWLWTWGGTCFEYRDNDDLWTYDGKYIGRFNDTEDFGTDGRYLGELRSNRLITRISSKARRIGAFATKGRRGAYVRYVNYVGNVMYAGYEDFPGPDSF